MKVVFSERRIGKLDSCNSNWRMNLVLMISEHSCMYYIYSFLSFSCFCNVCDRFLHVTRGADKSLA